jgi:chemotaxis protein MotB
MNSKKKKLNIPTIWMTVYGDFITNETLFFMLMFGTILMALQQGLSQEELNELMNKVSPEARQEEKARQSTIEKAKNEMASIEGVSGVALSERELDITLPESVLFEAGQARLKETARVTLAQVGKALAQSSDMIVVEGHTCDLPVQQQPAQGKARWELALDRATGLGPYYSNRELSAARALQVVKFFTKEKILPPERLVASACGSAQPLYPNDSSANRVKNRRIEIRVRKG